MNLETQKDGNLDREQKVKSTILDFFGTYSSKLENKKWKSNERKTTIINYWTTRKGPGVSENDRN